MKNSIKTLKKCEKCSKIEAYKGKEFEVETNKIIKERR